VERTQDASFEDFTDWQNEDALRQKPFQSPPEVTGKDMQSRLVNNLTRKHGIS